MTADLIGGGTQAAAHDWLPLSSSKVFWIF